MLFSTTRPVRSRSYRTPDTAPLTPRAWDHAPCYTATALDGTVQGGSVRAAAGQSWATTATGDAACSMTAWVTWPMCGPQRTAPDATGRHHRIGALGGRRQVSEGRDIWGAPQAGTSGPPAGT
jgi:hypothetical protein